MIFISSMPKAGTHLLATVMQDLFGEYPVPVRKKVPGEVIDFAQFASHSLLMGHFRASSVQQNPALQALMQGRKILILIRDPRDVCNSMLHYLLQSSHPLHRKVQPMLLGLPYAEQIKAVAAGLAAPDRSFKVARLQAHCGGFVEVAQLLPQACVLRYESFFDGQASATLAAFLELDQDHIAGAIDNALRSGSKTKRAGIASAWRDNFDPALQSFFIAHHGDIIRQLGYAE